MRSPAVVLLTSLALLLPGAAQARVFLLGVDGGSWSVLDPMLEAGELPHLAALLSRGVGADLATVEPVSSPVVWTSLATGRSPEAHGITDFFGTRLSVEVPSSFERLAAAGLRVGLYDYLMTWPPSSLPGGFVIPGWLRRDASVTPSDVWSRIPFAPHAIDYDTPTTSEDYLRLARRDVEAKPERFLALADAFALDVAATIVYSVDATSHRFWHGLHPEDFDPPLRLGVEGEQRAVRDAVLGVDRAVGTLAAALGKEDTLLIASDHGFETLEDGPRNVWVTLAEQELARAGLDPDRDGFTLISGFGATSFRVHPGDLAERDATTERLVAFLQSYRSEADEPLFSGVESVDVAERPPEARRPWLMRLRQWVVVRVLGWLFDVQLDATAHAVVFALPDDELLASLSPDTAVRVAGRSAPLQEVIARQVFSGGHHPTGIFLAAGGPVAHVPERGALSVLDVAPLLFHLAGQPIPDDLEGTLPERFLDAEALRARPARRVPASSVPALPASATTGETIDDPGLVEKLRALGYLE